MAIFNRIKNFFRSEPEQQVLGYFVSELQLLFQNIAFEEDVSLLTPYPKKSSLSSAGIHAVYTALLIDKSDMKNFLALVDGRFCPEKKRQFNGAAVIQSKSISADERLCFMVADEFEGHVVRLATDSLTFLVEIDQAAFLPPPPWIAFKGYNAKWWGGLMQGAQGYYDDHYFDPFFRGLSAEHKKAYCIKYSASPDWEQALDLFYD